MTLPRGPSLNTEADVDWLRAELERLRMAYGQRCEENDVLRARLAAVPSRRAETVRALVSIIRSV